MFKKGFFIFLAIFFFTFTVSAQTVNDGITINITPEKPSPNEEVTISLVSHAIDLNSSTITWRKDGVVALSGVGKDLYSFIAKEVGVQTNISIRIATVTGVSFTKQVVVTPMGVDLLWEAKNSIVPPLYKGKTLPGPGAEITFSAIPQMKKENGSFFNPNELIYTWKHNYNPVKNSSDSIHIEASNLRDFEVVSVQAESTNRQLGAFKNIGISADQPLLLFYELSPLYGPLFERSLTDGYQVRGSDLSIISFPYFLSPNKVDSSHLSYTWKINDQEAITATNPNILSLSREGGDTGSAIIELSVINQQKFFQDVARQLTLELI